MTKGGQAMPKVTMIHHVNVQSSNRQRTREWYEKVLGAEFLDRGPARNERQLQLRIGSGEMHFTEVPEAMRVVGHFAVEVDNWETTLAHLDTLGVPYARGGARPSGGDDPRYGLREDTGQYYTYIHDPDGNMIELVYHPLGIEDAEQGVRWTQLPGFVAPAYRDAPSTR